MAGKQRSGMLDLVRFILSVAVVMVHLIDRSIPSLTILRGGTISVEFFFVLSGFLLASSADRMDKSLPVSESTWRVMKRKVCSIYPTWLSAFLVVIAWQLFVHNAGLKDLLRQIEESTTSLLMISQLGLYDKLVIAYSWYIPVMLLCTLMLFPILYKHGKTFAYTAAPLVTVFGFAYLFHSFGKLYTLQSEWLGFTWAATVRGLSEMCLGVVAYAGSRRLTARLNGRLTTAGRVLFTVLEALALLYGMRYVFTHARSSVHLGVVVCFAIFIAMSYTGMSYTSHIVRGRFFSWLGRYSLSLYLAQWIPVALLTEAATTMSPASALFQLITLSLAAGLVVHAGAWVLRRLFHLCKDKLDRVCIQQES